MKTPPAFQDGLLFSFFPFFFFSFLGFLQYYLLCVVCTEDCSAQGRASSFSRELVKETRRSLKIEDLSMESDCGVTMVPLPPAGDDSPRSLIPVSLPLRPSPLPL